MIGVLVIGHVGVGAELLRAAEHVLGPQAAAEAVMIDEHDPIDEARARVAAVGAQVNGGAGVLALIDMAGGTPCKAAVAGLADIETRLVCGVNLPMLLTVLKQRQALSLPMLAQAALESGRAYIAPPRGSGVR